VAGIKDEFPFITMACVGSKDHGKTTLLSALARQLRREHSLDPLREEQDRKTTLSPTRGKFLLPQVKRGVCFVDCPGHYELVEEVKEALRGVDLVLVCCDLSEGPTETTQEHIERAIKAGVRHFIIVLTKKDLLLHRGGEEMIQKRATEIRSQLGGFFSSFSKVSSVLFLPVSALYGWGIPELVQAICGVSASLEGKSPVEKSRSIIREALSQFHSPCVLWSAGKDSTLLVTLVQKEDPEVPVYFVSTSFQFPETYEYVKMMQKEGWVRNLAIKRNDQALRKGVSPSTISSFECCTELKTKVIREIAQKHDCLFVGIRWSEHGIRGKESYFSPREDPPHMRVHPLLHLDYEEVFSELKRRGIPLNPLYSKEFPDGSRYISIGCVPCTRPASPEEQRLGRERAGRLLDKEKIMERLRSLGYP